VEEDAKKKKKTPEEQAFDPLTIRHFPSELLTKVLRARAEGPDLNAGAIFDNLGDSDFWPDKKSIIKSLYDAFNEENIQMILLK
jgi:hypothetical protein